MKRTIKWFMDKGRLDRDDSYKQLAIKFLNKARDNLTTMSVLFDLNGNDKIKELLKVPKEYDPNEWVVICGYYAMYSAALALVAKIGYRSKNHSATILVLEEFFVKKKELDKESIDLLRNAKIRKQEINELSEARHKREIAQYSITKETTKEIAENIKKDAYNFVNKVEELVK